ncbi:MAG TPA: sigma-70 family RNA polymerase sigma factor [Flavipsychrobacter sp.]|nr:sigma-70 family RNA polymerase sigma factor [Flavipsychrobacter sp.]
MSTPTFSVRQQLEAVKANNEKVLQQLYTANYGNVERYVLQNSGSVDEAKDIFQEAFIAAWRNIQLDKFVPAGENSLNGYLFQIAKHKWMDHLRSTTVKKTTTLDENLDDAMTFEEVSDNDVQRIKSIREQFKNLGDNCRELLVRFYYKKQALKDIATALKWTEATAKNNKYRCMEKLRTLVVK